MEAPKPHHPYRRPTQLVRFLFICLFSILFFSRLFEVSRWACRFAMRFFCRRFFFIGGALRCLSHAYLRPWAPSRAAVVATVALCERCCSCVYVCVWVGGCAVGADCVPWAASSWHPSAPAPTDGPALHSLGAFVAGVHRGWWFASFFVTTVPFWGAVRSGCFRRWHQQGA